MHRMRITLNNKTEDTGEQLQRGIRFNTAILAQIKSVNHDRNIGLREIYHWNVV